MIYSVKGSSTRRRAAAALEAAVVLPVLLLFLAGVVDIGRLGKIADCLSNAARNGAQYASTNSSAAADATNIRKVAITEMQNQGLPSVTSTNPTVTATTVTYSGTQFVQVTVTYDMTGTAYFKFFPVNSMTRTVQMRMMPQ